MPKQTCQGSGCSRWANRTKGNYDYCSYCKCAKGGCNEERMYGYSYCICCKCTTDGCDKKQLYNDYSCHIHSDMPN